MPNDLKDFMALQWGTNPTRTPLYWMSKFIINLISVSTKANRSFKGMISKKHYY
jgi:hypothetical protein